MSRASGVHVVEPSAGRPGPGPVEPSVLRALDITVHRRIGGLFSGEHRSRAAGIGTELMQIRPYVSGDDVRLIDPNATARTGEPHVKVHVGEREVATWLVLDTSISMDFGTADRRKIDVAYGVTLALGHVGTSHGNRLGLVTFGGAQPVTRPLRQGRKGLLSVLATLASLDREPDEGLGATSLGEALDRVGTVARQTALIVIVSDFRGLMDWRLPLLRLAARHDVVAVEIRDRREQSLPDVGELSLVDPETGKHIRIDTSSKALRRRFEEAASTERAQLSAALTQAGVDQVTLTTEGDWLAPLAQFLARRERRR